MTFKEYILEKLKVGDLMEYDEKDFEFYFRTEEGRNKITKLCIPYIRALSNLYKGYDPEDIFGFACFGFVKALNRYDPKRNNDFLKFCAIYIKEQINAYILDYSRSVRLPRTQQGENKFIKQDNLSLDDLISKNAYMNYEGDIEDNDKDDEDDNYGPEEIKLDNRLIEKPQVSRTDLHDMRIINDEIKRKLQKAFKPDEIDIFMSYYGLNGREKMKGKEIADKKGCTASNVTYILNKIHKYLSSSLNKELLELKKFMNEFYDD